MAIQGFNIDDFVSNFEFWNISFQSQFIIDVIFPSAIVTQIDPIQRKFMVTSSSMPGTGLEVTEINWQGITFPIAGSRSFPEWTITFRMDQAGVLREAYQQWLDLIHNPETNVRSAPTEYMITQEVNNVNQKGDKADTIVLYYCFPTNVAEITLDHSSQEVQTFDVTYRYIYSKYFQG